MECMLGLALENMHATEILRIWETMVMIVDPLVVVAIIVLGYLYYRWWSLHPLYGRNRGGKVYPIVGSLINYLPNRDRILDHDVDLLQKVGGGTIRAVVPPNRIVYITANPANVEYILKTNFVNYPKGEFINKNLRSMLGDGIFNADGHIWRIQRQAASQEFTTRSLNSFGLQTVQQQTNERLLPFLSATAESGCTIDMQDIFCRISFDTICKLGFGVDLACLSLSLPVVKFAEAFDTATRISYDRFQTYPPFLWVLKEMLDAGDAKKLRLAASVIDDFAMGVIENRRKELELKEAKTGAANSTSDHDDGVYRPKGGTDLLSRFMTMVSVLEDEKASAFESQTTPTSCPGGNSAVCKPSNVFLRDMIISFILAGRDTSTAALSWFFWLLSTHPRVNSAILEEIETLYKSRPPPTATEEGEPTVGSDLSFQELKGMHYLTAALTESMRLYPPVPLNVKTAKQADVLPDGTQIGAGSIVGYHPYAMGRMEQLWGKDCRSFRPERWLNAERAFVPVSQYKYPIFHGGPRICLGKDLVMMQMKVICVALLKNFQLVVSQNYKPEYELALTLRMKHGLPVTVLRRATC